MAELQRSVTSFRRQGSSGLVWEDKFIAGLRDQDQNETESVATTLDRSRSAGARPSSYRTVNVAPSSRDPPSPKVATCGLCGFFGKPARSSTRQSNPKSKKPS